MQASLATGDSAWVEAEVAGEYRAIFPGGDAGCVRQIFAWAQSFFFGRYGDYLPVDARYHDFEHTLQGLLCMARLLKSRAQTDAQPVLGEEWFQRGLLAMTLHDTGYLKHSTDRRGTGAKYTATHVERSGRFAAEFLGGKGFDKAEIESVQRMIFCTGVNANLSTIPFSDEEERIVGFALGTADYLGQMAAPDYVEKLPVLFTEFAEAAQFDPEHAQSLKTFSAAEELIARTPGFWRGFVLPNLEKDFGGLYKFLNQPYPNGPNLYIQAIEANLKKIEAGAALQQGSKA